MSEFITPEIMNGLLFVGFIFGCVVFGKHVLKD